MILEIFWKKCASQSALIGISLESHPVYLQESTEL
jgi:hypothetical protein